MKRVIKSKILLLSAVLFCCIQSILAQQIFYGDTASIGDGVIRTWIKTDASNNPDVIGVTITEDALTNLPPNMMMIHLDLPKGAADTLFNHVLFGWNPVGHPPPGIYDLPHFDVHYYIISREEREAIQGGPDTFTVASQYLPPDYVPDPVSIPAMGVHWTDTTSSEFHGETFTKTFVYGFSQGKFCFYEPMITKDYLESLPQFSGDIKQPEEFQKTGYYPTVYNITYDAASQAFSCELADFVFHQSTTSVEYLSQEVPDEFMLYQNYPNPFNPSTTIEFSIPYESNVKLKIFNSLGEEIAVLVNERLQTGKYSFNWDAKNHSSGIYFYLLETNVSDKRLVKQANKMILLK
ncbi:MAG TPA: DUF5602 domain-containing protein [Ignavibacteriaceae bacterium]|nr:DUF5602 domain-containing protein [Ignavibacteriaceae bacterium]